MSFVGSPYVFIPYPKWVAPHTSFVVTTAYGKIVPEYPGHFNDRPSGNVFVLVADAASELVATSQKSS